MRRMCWELFSGEVPFAGKMDGKIVAAHIRALNGGTVKRPKLKRVPAEVAPFIEACWAQDPTARPPFTEVKEMLNAVPILSIPGALNAPGYWDVFISHTQRNPEGKLLALDLHTTMEKKRNPLGWMLKWIKCPWKPWKKGLKIQVASSPS